MRSRRKAVGRTTTVILLAIAAALAASLAIVTLASSPTISATSTTSTHQTTAVSCVTASAAALNLSLSLTSSSIRTGQDIGFNASLFNTSCAENDVLATDDWGAPNLVIGPAGPTGSPIAYAVVQGFYTSANISSAPTIGYGVFGTTVMQGIKSYAFQPKSDVASVMGPCGPDACFTKSMSSSGGFNGYWSRQQIIAFTPGTYTVVVADEWGQVATSSFTVQG